MNNKLLYIHDPMCSWCYGFKPVLETLHKELTGVIEIHYLLGGLASDNNQPMPVDMQNQIKQNWRTIEKTIPGIKFNYEFWTSCVARRSTYPACRAILAAAKQDINLQMDMLNLIQQAYYLEARNPSDYEVLYELSKQLNLDHNQFIIDIHSDVINNELMSQIQQCRSIGADSFPSLYLQKEDTYQPVVLDYNNADIILDHIKSLI
ncbi:MAG: DsbA family protein [Gammaproteobacteria bacterium]|nr:DsbA family protein [Gammaproteobacteria bacterium]